MRRTRSAEPGQIAIVKRSERGLTVLEMVLVLPLLMLSLLGAIDLGRSFYTALCVSQAAAVGAAYGIQNNGRTSDYSGMRAATVAAARDLLGSVTATANRDCKCPGNVTVDCLRGTCGRGRGAPQIYVKVTATATFNTLVVYPGVPSTIAIARTAVGRAQ